MEEEIVGRTRDLAKDWLAMNTLEKRVVVETFVERITIRKDEVEIDLASLPPLSEIVAKGPPNGPSSWATSSRNWRARSGA
jgi:hypothetical protein